MAERPWIIRDRALSEIRQALREAIVEDHRDLPAELAAVGQAADTWARLYRSGLVTLDEIKQLDRSAAGHVDWFDKLTLRAADLAIYGEAGQP